MSIESVIGEASRRLTSDLSANDPIRPVAGQFVISDSASALKLITARAELPVTNALSRQLQMIPGQSHGAPHVSAEDLPTTKTGKGGGGAGDDETAQRAGGTKTDAEKSAAAEAKKKADAEAAKQKAKVGSKAAFLVEYHSDGKHVLLGPKSKERP